MVPNFDGQLLNELSGLDDASFNRVLQNAIQHTFQFPTDVQHVAVPLTISSSSHVSVSDGPAVGDADIVNSSADADDQPASAMEEFTLHSDIGPSVSFAGSWFSNKLESIEHIDLAIAEAEV